MKRTLASLILYLSLLMGAATSVSAQNFDKGVTAFRSGDLKAALREWLPLAKQGDADAQHIIGVTHYYGGEGVIQDYKEASNWYQLAAEQGHREAQYSLGMLHYVGEGVDQDYKQAMKWFRLAARQGNADAQFSLGVMYYEGKGVIQDYKEASNWYQLAAEQGIVDAQVNLGVAYALGQGVVEDYVKAHMWSNIAAANGSENGSNLRGKVAKLMTAADISKAQQLARKCKAKNYKGC